MGLDASPARLGVVLGPAAHVLRRRVGSSAWSVLEEMLAQSDVDGHGGRVAVVSVRSLAASLGVAKDTVHRATTRLRDLGVIEPHQTRTDAGSFSAGGYQLNVPPACLNIVDSAGSSTAAPPPAVTRDRDTGPSPISEQLSLLLEN